MRLWVMRQQQTTRQSSHAPPHPAGRPQLNFDDIWKDCCRGGRIGIDETRQRIHAAAGGIEPPPWWRGDDPVHRPRRAATVKTLTRH